MSEQKHPINELMATTMEQIKAMAEANTIVGEPIHTEGGVTLIPVSKISVGFASGGTDFSGKNAPSKDNFGGGAGAGVNISPVAFVVVNGTNVRILPMTPAPASTVDRVVEMVPEMFDKVTDYIDKKKHGEDKEVF